MSLEESIVKTAVHAWKQQLERADKLFTGLSEQQLLAEVAPGKNRLIYLWGHLTAVHDGMLPLLGLGRRLHPELDAIFITGADRTAAQLPAAAELKRLWDEVSDTLLAGFDRYTLLPLGGRDVVLCKNLAFAFVVAAPLCPSQRHALRIWGSRSAGSDRGASAAPALSRL